MPLLVVLALVSEAEVDVDEDVDVDKVVLVDDEITAIGSANMDNRSFRLNFEIMLLTVDEAFAKEVETMLEADFALSREITVEDSRQTNRLLKVGMRVARLISPIL